MGLSSCFILLGSALLYASCGLTSLDGIYVFYNIISEFGEPISNTYPFYAKPEIFSMGFLIISVGYLFKVSAAPFHFWSPDIGPGKSLLYGGILPNSGNTLELLVPSSSRKAICGWTNHSCMVTSQEASEKNVGNRGSKSVILNNIAVKEQRVYGSRYGSGVSLVINTHTLNGLYLNPWMRNFTKVNPLFNVLPLKFYSSLAVQNGLSPSLIINPWFATGFSDAEACFSISVIKNKERKVGWRVFHSFQINLHTKDKALLELIQSYFGVGSITYHNQRSESIHYRVESLENLKVILNHFDKYPLITKKWGDYQLFKQALKLIQNKEHLTIEGLSKIVAIKASMNIGLSNELKASFPHISPANRPNVLDCQIKDPNWLAGFTTGEGCFYIKISKSSSHIIGFNVQLAFQLTQHNKDELLLRSLIEFFNSGSIFKNGDSLVFKVTKFSDLHNKIVPFFKDYPILGAKSNDFFDWITALNLMKNKAHLTEEGLKSIQILKAGMNTGRKQDTRRMLISHKGNILPCLRCTLTGFERNYQLKILSNQIIQRRLYSKGYETFRDNNIIVDNKHTQLIEPWFVSGFTDAEGCFLVITRKAPKNNLGWQLEASFTINLHKKDVELLKLIQAYFGGVGRIGKERNGCCDFSVSSLNQILTRIVPHFDKYPLNSQKHADYLLFREVVMMMKDGEHLTVEGLQKIINIRATLNRGLTPALKEAFPNSVAVPRPQLSHLENQSILALHPQWVAGFTSGDGCFKVSIRESKAHKVGARVIIIFVLTQHIRDELLMKRLANFFGCGQSYSYKEHVQFICQSFKDNYENILPFFHKYLILGVKSQDFEDWCKVAEMIKTKAHLTNEGYDQIRQIRAGMNKGRLID